MKIERNLNEGDPEVIDFKILTKRGMETSRIKKFVRKSRC